MIRQLIIATLRYPSSALAFVGGTALLIWSIAAGGCKQARDIRITAHHVGGGCVALYVDVDEHTAAMAPIPCPVAAPPTSESADGGAR